MTRSTTTLAMLMAAALLFAACGPIVMIPGGALSGTLKPAPADWSFTDAIDNVQLETRPGDPYSVNVWGIGAGKDFFIAAGESSNTWAQHILEDPNVRLRVGDDLYELVAERTDSEADRNTFIERAQAKYDWELDEEQAASAILFRLRSR
jgi:hypothetical protein